MDGIEKLASLEWNKTPFIGPEGCYIDGFRAGWLAARKRAVEVCMNTEVSSGRVGSIQYATKRAIAAALERLGADEEA